MRGLVAILALLLLLVQYSLWFGKGGVRDLAGLERQIAAQKAENAKLEARNGALMAEVMDLKQGLDAIEEIARSEMGMVREGEVFFQAFEATPSVAQAPTPTDDD
ncbi:MAG: cell division protein FtsB [Gammaproteobacteria bacterium]|nr:cell division protein FtsB [Gammaproteobacteria bacterium]